MADPTQAQLEHWGWARRVWAPGAEELEADCRFQPVPWLNLTVNSQIPLLDKGFWEINTYCDWTLNPNIEFRVGHQYLQSNPNYVDSSELSFYTYLRLNDNWAFGCPSGERWK